MTDADYEPFGREFIRLHAALGGFRMSADEVTQKADAYFHVLKKFPLDVVIAKADRWLETEQKFPKPVEWGGISTSSEPTLETLTPAQAADWLSAERLRWQGELCHCPRCLQAGVTELQPIRFVPETTRDGRDRLVRLGERVVTAGRWIHGDELTRWYAAKSAAWTAYSRLQAAILADEPRRAERRKERFHALAELLTRVHERHA